MKEKINARDRCERNHGWWISYYCDEDPITKLMVGNYNKPHKKELFKNGQILFYQHYSYESGIRYEQVYIR